MSDTEPPPTYKENDKPSLLPPGAHRKDKRLPSVPNYETAELPDDAPDWAKLSFGLNKEILYRVTDLGAKHVDLEKRFETHREDSTTRMNTLSNELVKCQKDLRELTENFEDHLRQCAADVF